MFWIIIGVTFLLLWLRYIENPHYAKSYNQTRAGGAFSTQYNSKFENYLDLVKEEVKARMTLGPISPVDDLYTDLYHPELEENWARELCQNDLLYWLKKIISFILACGITLLLADGVTRILTNGYGLLDGLGTPRNIFQKMAALGFVIAAHAWFDRHRHSISQTQGYLDGYSDCYRKQR